MKGLSNVVPKRGQHWVCEETRVEVIVAEVTKTHVRLRHTRGRWSWRVKRDSFIARYRFESGGGGAASTARPAASA